jgi:hypothetical protein
MTASSVKPVRCAIYTRVSTEHGLDQEFNSLDAQYEAASAYVKSQAHAGWTPIRSRYDDGGYSGGSVDRPDLQRLLEDSDRLIIVLKSVNADDEPDSPDVRSLTVPWQKPPSRRSRQILLPHNAARSDVRPEQFQRRARLVSTIARGRQWLDDVVSGRVSTVAELSVREKCSIRQVNMTISLAFLAPNLVKAAVEGRLPRGVGIKRLRDPPTEWSQQFEALGLNPE